MTQNTNIYWELFNTIQHETVKPLTHWGWDKMGAICAILRSPFSDSFSSIKVFVFWVKFHWNLFPRDQLTISQYWYRLWLGANKVTSYWLEQCWPISPMHLCITWLQWVDSNHYDDGNLIHNSFIEALKTHLSWVTYTCMNKLGAHWFR